MVLESLMLLLALATPPKAPRLRLAPAPLLALAAPAAYQPHERAVGNWRFESALGLDLPPLGALKQFAGTAPAQTPRCVKLNNYWCIKRAGWNGEITSDPDGHVAFASAEEGAAVAALLLRRYYIEFKRHTAREIASRWAPSQCAAPAVAIGVSRGVSRLLPQRPVPMGMLPQRPLPMGLAPHGLFNTVRARWLATHLPDGAPRAGLRRPPPARARSSRIVRRQGIADFFQKHGTLLYLLLKPRIIGVRARLLGQVGRRQRDAVEAIADFVDQGMEEKLEFLALNLIRVLGTGSGHTGTP